MKKKCPKCGAEYENANTLCPLDGGVLVKVDDELVGQTLAGKYRVEERVNEGGMGTVYRATHVLMDKTVAVKVLHPALAADDKIVARFTREARAASRISHPHALNVTDFGEAENGVVFLVMEYLRGKTLKEIIRSEAPLSLDRVVEIVQQVSGALDAAHAEGVVHRDLKSDNIMLEEMGAHHDWAKVLDFGIAKIQEPIGQDPALTAPNLVIGTPQYMSPEQCSQASNIDHRSDIYSLGIIIYEMLVGHVPFTGASPTAIMMKHLQETPARVSEERDDVGPAVDHVIERALAKRPEERYQSAGELAESLAMSVSPLDEAVAAGAAAATVADTQSVGQVTTRMAVPTGSNEARQTANEDYDEATVVRAANPILGSDRSEEVDSFSAPPPQASSFNPYRIIVPALALLVVGFAVLYAIQRNSTSSPPSERALTSDPNSQPVQSVAPPTGESERGIAPSVAVTPIAPVVAGSTATGNANTGVAKSAQRVTDDSAVVEEENVDPTPTTDRNGRAKRDPNQAENADTKTDREEPEQTNSGTSEKARSSTNAARDEDDDDEAPAMRPTPTPKKQSSPQAELHSTITSPRKQPSPKQQAPRPESPPDAPPQSSPTTTPALPNF